MQYKGGQDVTHRSHNNKCIMYNARTVWWRRHRPSSAGDYSTRKNTFVQDAEKVWENVRDHIIIIIISFDSVQRRAREIITTRS